MGFKFRGDRARAGGSGPAGPDGASAYQIAVANGFVGTEAQWLASLVGPVGPASTVPGPAGLASTVPGPAGPAATVAVGTTTTGLAGTSASVTNSGTSAAAVFNFTIPRGQDGTNGTDGNAATVSVGTTTTGTPSTPASVTNVGTSSAAVLNFVIPKGDKGDPGSPGVNAVSRAAIVTTSTAGAATWTYSTPFPTGVTPVISATAQQAAGVIAEVQVTAVSNTSCSILVTRTSAITVSLLGLTILQIAGAASTQVHVTAIAPQ